MPTSQDCHVDLFCALWNARYGLDQYAKHRDAPGQRRLFGDEPAGASHQGHDVSQEPRDAHGEWTAGAPEKPSESVEPASEGATIKAGGTGEPAVAKQESEGNMGTQGFTVVLAREPSSDKQRQYMNDVLAQASAKLDELERVAPRSVEVVRKRHQDSLSKPKTHFADRIIGQYRDKDWLSEVYAVAERELRNKEETTALMPLRQAAADAFRAIPVAGQRQA